MLQIKEVLCFALILNHLLLVTNALVVETGTVAKEHTDCDNWAKDGECIKNPNFMWTSCHSSCLESAKDLEDRCREWAEEGECTNNPNFIHLHCPESCGFAAGWSPWVRRELRFK